MAYLHHLHQQHFQQAPSPYHYGQQQQQQQHHNMGMSGMMMMETEEDRIEAAAAEELLDCDSSHELMLPYDYVPCPNTVIVGRGKKVAQHPGNVRFRELVKEELAEYSAATTKAHKSSIIVRVLTEVRIHSHFAFVKQNLTTGRWYRVEETAQRITTAQAFRDALKDNYKSSRAFKKLKREEEKAANSTETVEKPKDKKEKKKAAEKEKKKPASPVPSKSPPPEDRAPGPPKPATASAATPAEKKPSVKPKSVEEVRAMLEQQQTALFSGNFSWWDPKAIPMTAPKTAPKEEERKMPPPSAIPSNSVSSCSSLIWSNHSLWSNHSRKDYNHNKNNRNNRNNNYDLSGHNSFKWSNHSMRGMSNHSIMTISGHSVRSNSTFNGLVSKYAPSSNADMEGNPFEPTPIPSCVQEDGGAMDMDLDDDQQEETPRSYVPRTGTTYDEGIALGLGNLSDHSCLSNMSSLHSVKGYTPEEIFADSNSMHGSGRDHHPHHHNHHHHHPGHSYQSYRRGGNPQQHPRNGYPGGRHHPLNFATTMSA